MQESPRCKNQQFIKSEVVKEQHRLALILHQKGLGFSHDAIYNWIKSFGEQIESVKQKEATIVEVDEMHSYMSHKLNYPLLLKP